MYKPFYQDGLRFECTRCDACCRHEPGYVFLSQTDLRRLA
ncbi:MAG TPA: YkgJ family cysteine cluster protein, partial [Spirochaetia bacterium]|nr:YkgJ family cysteine cluster protein [Spirochaetia bacterium]